MISKDEAEQVLADHGRAHTDVGHDLGPVARVFLDDYTGWPSFMTVTLDPATKNETFVALHEAKLRGRDVVVPYTLHRIQHAPHLPAGDELNVEQEDQLFDYYQVPIEGVEPNVARLGNALTTNAAK